MATEIYLGNPPENIVKWIKENYKPATPNYLCFTAEEASSTIKMFKNSSATDVYLETSPTGEEGSWSDFTVCTYNEDTYEVNDDGTTITLANVDDKVYFRAVDGVENLSFYGYQFVINKGKIAASGNLNTLLKADGSVLDLTGRDNCYEYMFYNCTSLTQAPELPATTLAYACYSNMFEGCESLTQAPKLPATTLANCCYDMMFQYRESPITFVDKTFDEMIILIENEAIFGNYFWEDYYNEFEIICSDKTMIATPEYEYNEEYGSDEFVGWTLTEK